LSDLVGGWLAVTGCGFEPLDGVVQPFLMGRGEGPKLDADPVRAGPPYNSALDQDRNLIFTHKEQEVHLHSRGGLKGTFEPASFS
jgi:hypothetical protein